MIVPLKFQKLLIMYLLLLTQHKQVTSKLNKQQFATVMIKAYDERLSSNLCPKL